MADPIIETWETHSRLDIFLIGEIPEEAFAAKPFGKGRSIGQVIAHIHNNRVDWLQGIAPDISIGLQKIDRSQSGDKASIVEALSTSANAVDALLQRSLETGSKVRGFGDHTVKFLGYLIAHESYHHGEIGIMLTQAGFPLLKETAYKIWDWKQK